VLRDEIGRLVLTHKNSLLSFGAELIFAICELIEIVIINKGKDVKKNYYDRMCNLEKIDKYITGSSKSKLKNRLRKPYINLTNECGLKIDYNKLEQESLHDGYFAFRTNIENPNHKEILNSYKGLWQIEQTFRIAKSNLNIRPLYHYNPRRIKSHFAICYATLALIRHVEYVLKTNKIIIPLEQIHLMLDKMKKIRIQDSKDQIFELLENPPLELISIYQKLNISWHKKFQLSK
jgi:transposase